MLGCSVHNPTFSMGDQHLDAKGHVEDFSTHNVHCNAFLGDFLIYLSHAYSGRMRRSQRKCGCRVHPIPGSSLACNIGEN